MKFHSPGDEKILTEGVKGLKCIKVLILA